jgi:hypothetical protein
MDDQRLMTTGTPFVPVVVSQRPLASVILDGIENPRVTIDIVLHWEMNLEALGDLFRERLD